MRSVGRPSNRQLLTDKHFERAFCMDDDAQSPGLHMAGSQCTDWQLKTVPSGSITLYWVAVFGIFGT